MMAEGDLHSYVCDDSSQESASDSEDFLEGKFDLPNYNVCMIHANNLLIRHISMGTPEILQDSL